MCIRDRSTTVATNSAAKGSASTGQQTPGYTTLDLKPYLDSTQYTKNQPTYNTEKYKPTVLGTDRMTSVVSAGASGQAAGSLSNSGYTPTNRGTHARAHSHAHALLVCAHSHVVTLSCFQ